jgi:hypothetical protein
VVSFRAASKLLREITLLVFIQEMAVRLSRDTGSSEVLRGFFHSLQARMPGYYLMSRSDNLLACPINNKTNSGALVLQRIIPTERPPLVGEVSANFSG